MRNAWRLLISIAILIAIVIGVLRATALRWWRVPDDDPYLTASIAPTLQGGDWVLLWRAGTPELGDLVLCPEPGEPSRIVIGRIAATEGSTIQVMGTNARLDNQPLRTEGACPKPFFTIVDPATNNPVEQSCRRAMIGGRVHLRGNALEKDAARLPEAPVTLGSGQIYLLSDNRQFPYDSRDFGAADRNTCTERVFFRLVGANGFSDVATRLMFID